MFRANANDLMVRGYLLGLVALMMSLFFSCCGMIREARDDALRSVPLSAGSSALVSSSSSTARESEASAD